MMDRRRKRRRPVWPKLLIGLLCLVLLTLGGVLLLDRHVVEVQLNGAAEITVEYGSEFSDPGATACWHDNVLNKTPTALAVTVSGAPNMEKPGTYTVLYEAEYKNVSNSVIRTIHVVDSVAPEIVLVSDPEYYTVRGQEYREEGFTATDNCDGDITDRVQRNVIEDTVVYTVRDSSGNTAEVTRKIVYVDADPPTLTLEGDGEITVTAGAQWKDPGCKAVDFEGKDLTDTVTVEGTVNTDTAGTYELTYTVTDDYGNTVSVKRKVTVKKTEPPKQEPTTKPQPQEPDNGERVIYLTFDDGPSEHTPRLLEILKKYNVKATFFVVKTRYPQYLKDIAADGHAIGVHSLTHDYETIYASESAFFEDYNAMSAFIKEQTGVTPAIMRFPGGASNSISKRICAGIMTKLTKAVTEKGLRYFDWNVDSNDAGGAKTADEVAQNVINGVKNRKNSVVLQHDTKGFSVEAVEQIIIWALDNGYTFKALDSSSPACQHQVNN